MCPASVYTARQCGVTGHEGPEDVRHVTGRKDLYGLLC